MGTEKRERKKQNRELGRQVQQQRARREKTIKSTVRITGAVVLVIAVFFAIAFLTDNGDDAVDPLDSAVPTSSATTDGGETTPAEFVYGSGECAPADGSAEQKREFDDAPALCIDPAKAYTAVVTTNMGEYTITLDPAKAPGTVNSFVNLARFKYFDGITCHRAIPGFMVQCGDPTGTGSGGPGYTFADELPAAGEYKIGSVAMANAGPNTNGSQFFVITGDQGVSLPPSYTLFGEVTAGLDTTIKALDAAGNPNDNGVPPLQEIIIESIVITEA